MPSRNEAHPGARASRPHAPPSRVAQFVYDVAAGHPGGGNGVGLGEADPWRVCRSSGVEEMGEAVRRRMQAGRPRSLVGCLFQWVLLLEEACARLLGLIPADGAEP